MTPTKQRDAAEIALGVVILNQVKALEKSLERARSAGVRVYFRLSNGGTVPEILEIYVDRGNKAKKIGAKVFYGYEERI